MTAKKYWVDGKVAYALSLRKSSPAVRDELIALLWPLCTVLVYKKYLKADEDLKDDLVGAASLGLINAVDKFNPALSENILAYVWAGMWVSASRFFWKIHVVPFMSNGDGVGMRKKIREAIDSIGSPNPSMQQIADEAGMTRLGVRGHVTWMRGGGTCESLSTSPIGDLRPLRSELQLAPSQLYSAIASEEEDIIRTFAGNMKEDKARTIFLDALGMYDSLSPRILEDLARIMKPTLSRQRVQQIRKREIDRFENYLESKGI